MLARVAREEHEVNRAAGRLERTAVRHDEAHEARIEALHPRQVAHVDANVAERNTGRGAAMAAPSGTAARAKSVSASAPGSSEDRTEIDTVHRGGYLRRNTICIGQRRRHEARKLFARRPAELRRGRRQRRDRSRPPDRRQAPGSARAHHGEGARRGEARRRGREARREPRRDHFPAGHPQPGQDRLRRPQLRGAPGRDQPRQDREPGALPAGPRLAARPQAAAAAPARIEDARLRRRDRGDHRHGRAAHPGVGRLASHRRLRLLQRRLGARLPAPHGAVDRGQELRAHRRLRAVDGHRRRDPAGNGAHARHAPERRPRCSAPPPR